MGACGAVATIGPPDRGGAVAAVQRIHLSVHPDPAEANAVKPFRFFVAGLTLASDDGAQAVPKVCRGDELWVLQ